MNRWPPIAAVAFAGLLLGCGQRDSVVPALPDSGTGVAFADVTAEAKIEFRHNCGATGRKLLPETMGAGVVVLDFNADGKPDLYFVNSRSWPDDPKPSNGVGQLYRNNGDGTFRDVTAESGLNVALYGQGGCAGDFDNDGFPDLFVTAVGGNRLFRNIEGKRFEDITDKAGLNSGTWPKADGFAAITKPIAFPASATFLDFDGDGKLDLFVCQYLSWSPALDLGIRAVLPGGQRAYVPPTQFPGTLNKLYRNLGNGRFADVSAESGIEVRESIGANPTPVPNGKSLGVVVCDPDADGWPDLAVANDTVRNFFFHNIPDGRGGRAFEEIGLPANVAYAEGRPRGGMGIDSAELAPGKPGLVIANFTNESNTLLSLRRNSPLLFQDDAPSLGLAATSRGPMKFGAFHFDYDNDGRIDLLTVNGHLEPDIGLARAGQTQAEAAQLFRNAGTTSLPTFQLVADAGDLTKPRVSRGCAYLDFNADGAPDVVVTSNNGNAKLLRNDSAKGNHWLRLKLTGDGVRSNRDAIGAIVDVTVGMQVRRFIVAGARGYLSQSELTITVGLENVSEVEKVEVRWPGKNAGKQSWAKPAVDREHLLKQE